MKELNKNEIYSLEGLNKFQKKILSQKTNIDVDGLKEDRYIVYEDCWRYGWSAKKPTAKAIDLFEEEKTQLFGITTDKVVQSVMNDLNERSRIGVEKYNTTLEREDLSLKDWLQHAYEETLDKANYLKRAILELEK